MALLYIDEAQASLNRADVASGQTVYEGEFIVQNDDGTVQSFDPASDALPHGIVVHHPEGDAIVEDEYTYVSYSDLWKYNGDDGDRLYYQPLASVDQVLPRTLTDNGTDPAPSINEGVTVGIVTINGKTEVVESGYTDDAGTIYSESDPGDFVAIGRVDKEPQQLRLTNGFGMRVPVRLDADLFTTSG